MITKDRLEKLQKAWYERRLTPNEIEEIRCSVKELEISDPMAYDLVMLLGRASDAADEVLVERFLKQRQEPMLTGLALDILAGDWGLGWKYRHLLLKFGRGVDWDDKWQWVRINAVSSSGEYLAEYDDRDVALMLLAIAEDTDLDRDDRQAAVESLARSLGISSVDAARTGITIDNREGRNVVKQVREKYEI